MNRTHSNFRRFVALAGAGVAALSLLYFTMSHEGVRAATPPPTTSPQVVGQGLSPPVLAHEQLSGWEYIAMEDQGAVGVVVSYDRKTRQGVEAFAQANRQLAGQVQGPIKTSVVFARPLSLDEFREITAKSGFKVSDYTMRATESNGLRVTLFGRIAAQANGAIPPDTDQQVTIALQHGHNATLKGVITMEGVADPAQIAQLLADSRVYTTEVTQAIASQRVQATVAARNTRVSPSPVEARLISPLYWAMEDTGIAPK